MTLQHLIAPCGMNCALCQAYQGKGLVCHGCGHGSERKAFQNCSIRKCENKKLFASNVQNIPAAD